MRVFPSIVLLIAAVILLTCAGGHNPRLLELRETHRISATTPLENAPPLVAFTTVALGGFRGLLADMLWLRISYLQDDGDYFELVQLSDWITKLEPRCAEIWGFHAWNLAYNISVMFSDPDDRWRWVENGMKLLRDKGILYNPGAPMLYCDLGWLFQHKLGDATDDAHMLYKKKWSERIGSLIGGSHPDYDTLEADAAIVRQLREEYKLLPDVMRQIDEKYGPLDWLCPETHAVYWAYRGRMRAPDALFLPADRMIYQSLAAMFRYGGRAWWLEDESRPAGPDPARLPGVLHAYREALDRYDNETVRYAYLEFLHNSVLLLAEHKHVDTATEMYNLLRLEAPDAALPPDLDTFLRQAEEPAL